MLSACSLAEAPSSSNNDREQTPAAGVISEPPTPLPALPTPTATPLPPPPRLLTICLGREPRSLFLYDASSLAEMSVLAAVYDGPFDVHNFLSLPVIVEKLPSQADGDSQLEPVTVQPGDLIVDASGSPVTLAEGVLYRPSGCTQQACALPYSGDQPVQIDQWVLRFRLLAGLQWSDGAPLTAADSVYSFQVAQSLYPAAWPERVTRTAAYQALDERTVEWRGLPGYQDGRTAEKFFPPLPQHAWGSLAAAELATTESVFRTPLGWGAYVIDEWTAGDHITLSRNPLYFRAAEGLPHFDTLVFRFVADGEVALAALLAGECDLIDQTVALEGQLGQLQELSDQGSLSLTYQTAAAWELLAFGIRPIDENRPAFFAQPEVRQAVAQCIDRQELAQAVNGVAAEAFLPPTHPLLDASTNLPAFDPAAGAALLEAAGWLDLDNDPSIPRQAQGVPGVTDGTAFVVDYLVSPNAQQQTAAQMVQARLNACGMQVNKVTAEAQDYLAAGPEGAVFGRHFDLAEYAWATGSQLPCDLYITNQIPGPYPDYPLGWGGANASGFSSPAYDQTCADALYSLPDSSQHAQASAQVQALFAQELPALPLYWHLRLIVSRPDLCGLAADPLAEGIFAGLEDIDYGEACP